MPISSRPLLAVRRAACLIAPCLALALVGGCGGGSGGTASVPAPPSTPPPASLSYPAPPPLTVGTAMTPLSPTVSGSVTSYGVSPPLPAGLSLNATSGVISGTPAAVAAATRYTVTASNAGGSAKASVAITVDDIAPTFAYGASAYSYTAGVAPEAAVPVTGGGKVVGWSVSPALPAGLAIDPRTGSIGGTPTAGAAATSYLVSATNSGGTAAESLTLAVAAAPLLDLGHVDQITVLLFDGTSVLSEDEFGRWVLWNFATAAELASGTLPCLYNGETCPFAPLALAGGYAMIGTATGLEIRSTATGQVVAEITIPVAWAALAGDGSYLCAGSGAGLTCWTPAGQQLFSEPGDYSGARVAALPGALLVGLGAKGQNVIETVTAGAWTSVAGATFSGSFYGWFQDGSRFLATDASTNTVWVYSDGGMALDERSLPTLAHLGGTGNWFWTFNDDADSSTTPLNVYAVGNSALPTAAYSLSTDSQVLPSAQTIGVYDGATAGLLHVIDLSGATPADTDFTLPVVDESAYAAVSASGWLAGTSWGVLLDGSGLPGAPRYLGYGRAWSLVGGGPRLVLSTASGSILSFNAATGALEQTIATPSAQLALSSDGTVLATLADQYDDRPGNDRTINVYSMPGATLLASYPAAYGTNVPVPVTMTLAGSGSTLGDVLLFGYAYTRESVSIPSGTLTWSATAYLQDQPVQLSPDGTLVAVSSAAPDNSAGTATTTSIYRNGTLLTTLSGWAVGWLDNARLLVNNYGPESYPYLGASIYGPTGTPLGAPALPELQAIQPLGGELLYAPALNQVLSLTTPTPPWQSGDPGSGLGAVTSSGVAFVSGTLVLVQPQ
jgi:hypothetical protein